MSIDDGCKDAAVDQSQWMMANSPRTKGRMRKHDWQSASYHGKGNLKLNAGGVYLLGEE